MKMKRIIFHLLQLLLAGSVFVIDDLYKNHLGVMRSISYHSQQLANSSPVYIRFVPLLLFLGSLLFLIKKRTLESGLLAILAGIFLLWQVGMSLAAFPLYYVVMGIIGLLILLQILLLWTES